MIASTILIQGNTLGLTMQITRLGKDSLLFPTGRIQNSYAIAVHLSMDKGNKQSNLKLMLVLLFDLPIICLQSEFMA